MTDNRFADIQFRASSARVSRLIPGSHLWFTPRLPVAYDVDRYATEQLWRWVVGRAAVLQGLSEETA